MTQDGWKDDEGLEEFRGSNDSLSTGQVSMGTRVYVGNLSFHTTEDSLRAFVTEGGRAASNVSLVTDRDSGQPRGFAFVDFPSGADAQAAIGALNGTPLDGRTLTVNEAREREPRGAGGGGGRGRGGHPDR
jgi:RNA recognition motif-containing protein